MSFLQDFNIYEKISHDDILENGMTSVKLEYKYFINIDGNILARKEGVFKSFEILANKISGQMKSVVIFYDDERIVIVYNNFWDSHHKTILHLLDEETHSGFEMKNINRLAEIVKIFCMGFKIKTYFVSADSPKALKIRKIFQQRLSEIEILNEFNVASAIKECHFIENNLQKSKSLAVALATAAAVFIVLNSGFAYVNSLIKAGQKKELSLIESKKQDFQSALVLQVEKIEDLNKRINDGKVWCN